LSFVKDIAVYTTNFFTNWGVTVYN
jgi:hypothetical protein